MLKIPSRPLIALLALFPLLFSSCGDGVDLKCDDSNTLHINQHARDFFYFKPGTWWLYEQEGTGLTDSIWVSSAGIDWDNNYSIKKACKCGSGKCTEKASVELQNKAHNGSDYLCSYSLSVGLTDGITRIGGSTPGMRKGFSPLAGSLVYKSDNELIADYQNAPPVNESMDTLTVNGRLYHDILHRYFPSGEFGNAYLHETWFSRNLFIVRFRKADSTIWNLIDFNVVK